MRHVVPEGEAEEFARAAMHLVEIKDYTELRQDADALHSRWPHCRSWLEWWIGNSAAKTLFKAQRTMLKEASDKIPDSTNAQEAMHKYFYMALGNKHNIITGV
jgi:hypothetical protein